jgi:iron transport multicopper oxidase
MEYSDPNFIFTIDGHTFTIIQVDSVNVAPLKVDSIQICTYPFRGCLMRLIFFFRIDAGQRYSFVLTANQPVDNYWIHTVANGGTAGFDNGICDPALRRSCGCQPRNHRDHCRCATRRD